MLTNLLVAREPKECGAAQSLKIMFCEKYYNNSNIIHLWSKEEK